MAAPDALFAGILNMIEATTREARKVKYHKFRCKTLAKRMLIIRPAVHHLRSCVADSELSLEGRVAVNKMLDACVRLHRAVHACTAKAWLKAAYETEAAGEEFTVLSDTLSQSVTELDLASWHDAQLWELEDQIDRALDIHHLKEKMSVMRQQIYSLGFLPNGDPHPNASPEIAQSLAKTQLAISALEALPHTEVPHREITTEDEVLTRAMVGQGSLGYVYEALLDGESVAMKILAFQQMHSSARRMFHKEAAMLQVLHHPNLIKVIGSSTIDELTIYSELTKFGNLEQMMADTNVTWSIPTRIAFLHDIAQAMLYLHRRHILHGHLHPRNVMIFKGFVPKLADYGLRRTKEQLRCFSLDHRTTAPWMSPEVLFAISVEEKDLSLRRPSDESLTRAADVYSFGVLCWQVLSDRAPWQGVDFAELVHRVTQLGERLPPLESDTDVIPRDLHQLILLCFDSVEDRPSFQQIVLRLAEIIEEVGGDPRNRVHDTAEALHALRMAKTACSPRAGVPRAPTLEDLAA